jgi:uncharacterized protein (DUF58 family)
MSFSEVRGYAFGDDVRAIDWNVTARTGSPHIKVFEEERELQVLIVVDVSASSFFGTGGGPSKQDLNVEMAAMLAFSAISNHDKVGLLLYSDRPELYLPPRTGRPYVLRIIRELLTVPERVLHQKTSISSACQYVQKVLKRRSVVLFLSDFQSVDDFTSPLRGLAHRHDVAGLLTWDQRERTLPDVGLVQITDPETQQKAWIDTHDPAQRSAYTRQFDQAVNTTAQNFRSAGADLVILNNEVDYIPILKQFFEHRAR